ncbi:winged helix-turn-helix domain-containing protein [Candidatus Woesearchaeota archaeon]|nr:winged helix-turn-helix domain-containing protein [Candidatus Woesearchaeota archaeon]
MKNIELVYREILFQAMEKKNRSLTQLELSKKLSMSLSTVNHAVKPLRKMNAVRIKLRSMEITDPKKILYYWASIRNMEKDITYKTYADMPVRNIENNMPDNIVFAAYSAYKLRFKDVPADYSEVYVYGEGLEKRFPASSKTPNLFVMKKDPFIESYGKTTTLAQTFVDLWNVKEWYAKDFLKAMEEKINGILE